MGSDTFLYLSSVSLILDMELNYHPSYSAPKTSQSCLVWESPAASYEARIEKDKKTAEAAWPHSKSVFWGYF